MSVEFQMHFKLSVSEMALIVFILSLLPYVFHTLVIGPSSFPIFQEKDSEVISIPIYPLLLNASNQLQLLLILSLNISQIFPLFPLLTTKSLIDNLIISVILQKPPHQSPSL